LRFLRYFGFFANTVINKVDLIKDDNCPMTRLTLTIQQRKAHRADAHHLDPVVMIGGDGLTPAVQKEVDNALKSHGLIKVRVLGDDREARLSYYNELADALGAAQINNIGKLLVLWRPKIAKEKTVDEDRMAGPKDVKILKYASRGGQRPEVKMLRVLGNERLTRGGTVKRAKVKQKSVKKASQG
jgi:putative YhbY family RNA-binding protein